ncbi:MAG: toll/interleukin-1 receptor domain-containing protein [Leptolyngbyaceae cyanobacterium]
MSHHIFISHSTQDDEFVRRLRESLEAHGQVSWVDSRELTGGNALTNTIKDAIRDAQHFLVVISPDTFNSKWVPQEVRFALEVAQAHNDGYKVIPVLLPGVDPDGMVAMLFPNDPLYIFVGAGPTGLNEAVPRIAAALGWQLPNDWESGKTVEVEPVEELLLALTDPRIVEHDGVRRATAQAELIYLAADDRRDIKSRRYRFTAPLGPVELGKFAGISNAIINGPLGSSKAEP